MRRQIQLLVLTVACSVAYTPYSSAADNRQWVAIGESEMGPWQVYIDKQSIKRDDRDHMHVHVLDDYRVTQSGIDRFDENGDLVFRDENYQYRSTITHYVLDCDQQKEVMLSVAYYDGDMGKGNLILYEQPSNAYWSDILFLMAPKLTSAVCE